MTDMMVSSMTTEGWREQNILTPAQVCGDVINVLNGVSLTECAVYCLGQIVMCFMFEFIYLNNVCRLFSGIASPNGTHLLSWKPFLAHKGLSNCERSGYTHVRAEEAICFKAFKTKLTWRDARTKCEEEEGRLLVLRNYKYTETVMNLDLGRFSAWFWIGLSDAERNGDWKWVDGTTFNNSVWHRITIDGRSNTYPSEPNIADCMRIKWTANYLNDAKCKGTSVFLCERPQLL